MVAIVNKNNKSPSSSESYLLSSLKTKSLLRDLIDTRTKTTKHLQLLFQNLIINKELKQQRQ